MNYLTFYFTTSWTFFDILFMYFFSDILYNIISINISHNILTL